MPSLLPFDVAAHLISLCSGLFLFHVPVQLSREVAQEHILGRRFVCAMLTLNCFFEITLVLRAEINPGKAALDKKQGQEEPLVRLIPVVSAWSRSKVKSST
ncbi:hypothetical protein EK904_007649 [Melospiza melodia maxima]|nr:hypothetical protein EK904_007649 [Melospiza melodia maxima]